MNLKNSLIIFGIAAGISLLAFLLSGTGGTTAVAEASSGRLVAEASMHDFGTIEMTDGDVMKDYKVRNAGTEPVTITMVYTSCMCTTANVVDASGRTYRGYGMPGHGPVSKADITVAPGETAIVEAVFDPAAHGPSGIGLADRTIYLETNSAETPILELAFRAMVTR
jgi:hypothetical protein